MPLQCPRVLDNWSMMVTNRYWCESVKLNGIDHHVNYETFRPESLREKQQLQFCPETAGWLDGHTNTHHYIDSHIVCVNQKAEET